MARKHVFERDPSETGAILERVNREMRDHDRTIAIGPDWAIRRCGCGGSFKEQLVKRPDGQRYFVPVNCRCKPDCLYHHHQGIAEQLPERRGGDAMP